MDLLTQSRQYLYLDSYTSFKIENILSVNIHGEKTLLAFNWTDIKDRDDRNLVNEDLYYGNPIMLIKVYVAAQLWLNSELVFPYLVAIGQQDPMYRKHAFMLMKPNETGDNEKSFGEPGYYRSTIGSWTNIFAVLKHTSDNWDDCSDQMKQWAALVLIYDAMHFIQQELKRLESRMSCQLWLNSRNKIRHEMNKAQRAVLGDCFNLQPFVEIMAFLIEKISPKMTFLKDPSTDYQVFTRPIIDRLWIYLQSDNYR